MGSVSMVSALGKGNVSLLEMVVPRMRHHSNDDGVKVADVPMPENSLIVAVDVGNDAQVASPDVVLYPSDKVVVVADKAVVDEVRQVFKGL